MGLWRMRVILDAVSGTAGENLDRARVEIERVLAFEGLIFMGLTLRRFVTWGNITSFYSTYAAAGSNS